MTVAVPVLRSASAADLPAVEALLSAAGLPLAGVADAVDRFVVAGLRRLYLLTTTAEEYFPRYGFRRIPRESASPAARESVEFREACPASAVTMVLELE